MTKLTYCPYCGTANLVKNQLRYIDEYGTHVFLCQMCGHMFTDLSIRQEEQKTSTNQEIENNGKERKERNPQN